MRWLFALVLGTLIVALAGSGRAEEKGKEKGTGIPGVKGQYVRVERNQKTAAQVENLKVKAGTWIEIEWTYPVAPPFPSSVEEKSSDTAVVKPVTVVQVVHLPRPIGVDKVGAFFVAEKAGHATLTFTIKVGDVATTPKVEVDVE